MTFRNSLNAYEKTRLLGMLGKRCQQALDKSGYYEEKQQGYTADTLQEFMFQVSPDLDKSYHLVHWCNLLDRAPGAQEESVVHAPPQVGKTTVSEHAIIWWDHLAGLGKMKPYQHAYVTYSIDIAREKAIEFKQLAARAGFNPQGTLGKIVLKNGTVIRFTSVGARLTGTAVTGVMIVDDPHKDLEDARSVALRRQVVNWWRGTARTRRHPGASYFVMATRWHKKDLSGILIDDGWPYLCLQAIYDGKVEDPNGREVGEALWPSERPVEFYAEERRFPQTWASMYQGHPIPEGSRMFHEPNDVVREPVVDEQGRPMRGAKGEELSEDVERGPKFYSELPNTGFKMAMGLDVAGTESKSADWTVLVVGRRYGDDLYILDVVRQQTLTTKFGEVLRRKQEGCPPGTRIRWYAAGPEKSVADHWRAPPYNIKHLKVLPATSRKDVRALHVSRGWNDGHVFLPDPTVYNVPWYEMFLQVVCDFTGADGATDDDVDALAALWDELFPKRRSYGVAKTGGGGPPIVPQLLSP